MTARFKEHVPELVTIAVSQHRDVLDMVWLINHGQIFRFLRKPLSAGRCAISLQAALQHHRMLLKNPDLVKRHEVDHHDASGIVDGVLAKLKNMKRLWGSRWPPHPKRNNSAAKAISCCGSPAASSQRSASRGSSSRGPGRRRTPEAARPTPPGLLAVADPPPAMNRREPRPHSTTRCEWRSSRTTPACWSSPRNTARGRCTRR